MDKDDILLEIKNASVFFKKKKGLLSKSIDIKVIENIDISVKAGEILALVGESGCGKTTLGKLITGIIEPTHGEVLYKGIPISKMDKRQFNEYRNSVQMVQQDSYAALNPSRTIYQSLSGPLLEKKIVKNDREARARVKEILETVELYPPELFFEKYPHQLSGGQRQRILMARAISLSPKLIVADEPVSMIDVSLRISILNLMSSLNKKLGIAFVYITHDLATARYIAQNGRIAVMYLGKIVELGNVIDVINMPRHPYLQVLLSAVPIPNPVIAKSSKRLPLKSIDMPSIINPPKGCRFNPRCIYASEKCDLDEPRLCLCETRLVACHNVEKIPEWHIPFIKASI